MLKIQISDDPKHDAGAYINSLLATYFETPVLLMIAGGSSREVLSILDPELISENVTITVTDERYTDDLDDNNFSALQATHFYNDLIEAGAYCIDTQIFQGESHKEHAARFAKNLVDWRRDFPNGKIIALFGVGEDGHIAGIIPGVLGDADFDKAFNSKNVIVVDLEATGNKHALRTTVTFPFMKDIDFPLVYMTGIEKTKALANVVAKEGSLYKTPARILQEMKDPLIFTDISVEKA